MTRAPRSAKGPRLLLLLLPAALLAPRGASALPRWSWDTMQTYTHCANMSGAWNAAAAARMARGAFVVFEKTTGLFAEPVADAAEQKIVDACRQVKAVDPGVDCFMYTESDWARTWYRTGREFDEHPAWELHADARPGAPLVNTTDIESDGTSDHTYYFNAYDFSVPAAQAAWVARVAAFFANSSGALDGAFIDGNRGGWSSGILAGTSPAHAQAWAAGLNASHRALSAALGPRATLISNYATDEALAVCEGGMMERGGSSLGDVQLLQQLAARSCGLHGSGEPCLVDYHAQYADRDPATFNATVAAFLAGMGKYAYYGRGGGWDGVGEQACASWLEWMPEYSRPLGEPAGPAAQPAPGVFTRSFATGTKVFINTTRGGGHCVWWADGATTGNPATCAAGPGTFFSPREAPSAVASAGAAASAPAAAPAAAA